MGDEKLEAGAGNDRAVWAKLSTMNKAIDEIRDALIGKLGKPGDGALHQIEKHRETIQDHESRLTEAEEALNRTAKTLEVIGADLGRLTGKAELLVRLEAGDKVTQAEIATLKAENAALRARFDAQNEKALDRGWAVRLIVVSALISLLTSLIGGGALRLLDRGQSPAPQARPAAAWVLDAQGGLR